MIKLVVTHLLLLPVLIISGLIFPAQLIPILLIAQTALIILFLSGYWEFFGLKFRVTYSVLIELLIVILLGRKLLSHTPLFHNLTSFLLYCLIQAYMLVTLFRIVWVIFIRDRDSLEVSFPVRNGRYLITDGGNSRISRLMNYHYYSPLHRRRGTNNSMKFATDIVKIGSGGGKFMPPGTGDYAIFGENVYSPISGVVVRAENSVDDNIPYSGNYPYNTGNTIVIKHEDLYLLIGHLKKGSLKKETGDPVQEGELIAEAGNSGYSERPHIHMQLINSGTDNFWSGRGVGLTFMGKNIFKNRIIDA